MLLNAGQELPRPATKFTHTPEMLSGRGQHSALPPQRAREHLGLDLPSHPLDARSWTSSQGFRSPLAEGHPPPHPRLHSSSLCSQHLP